MSNFPIKVGDSSGIDTYASTLIGGEEQLLITRDGKQYLSKGDGTKLDISDIEFVDTLPQNNIKLHKIYILSTNGTYTMNYYDGSAWVLLGGGSGLTQAQIDEIAKISSKQNSTDTNLATPVQTVVGGINYINGELTTVKGDLGNKIDAINAVTNSQFTSHTGNINNPHQTKIINLSDVLLTSLLNGQTIIYDSASGKFINGNAQSDGKLKMDSSSVADYLNNLIDGLTIQNVSGKLVTKSMEGLTVDVATINYLNGLNQNIMTLIGNLTNPMTMLGVFDTHALLIANTSAVNGSTAIVKVDETNSNKQMMYLYIGTGTYNSTNWTAVSQSNVDIRNFTTNPINLTNEVTGVLPVTNIDTSTLAKTSDLSSYLDKASYVGTGTTPVNVANTLQGMVSTVSQVDNSVSISHNHTNKVYLDKFGEDVTGFPTYNGNIIGGGGAGGLVTTGDGTTYLSDNAKYTKPDTSALLDKATYKGSADGIVKMADSISGELSAKNDTVYRKNNNGVVGWFTSPISAPINSTIVQLEFNNLITDVPQTQDFNPPLSNIKTSIQCYELITGIENTDVVSDFTNTLTTNKKESVITTINGLKIKDNHVYDLNYIISSFAGYLMKESQEININEFEILANIK